MNTQRFCGTWYSWQRQTLILKLLEAEMKHIDEPEKFLLQLVTVDEMWIHHYNNNNNNNN